MQKKRTILIFLIIIFIAGCCPGLHVANSDFGNCKIETLVELIHKDIMDAVKDPSFLEQTEFLAKWQKRTENWDKLLVELQGKATAAGKAELAEKAAELNATLDGLSESTQGYRELIAPTLKKEVEELKSAL